MKIFDNGALLTEKLLIFLTNTVISLLNALQYYLTISMYSSGNSVKNYAMEAYMQTLNKSKKGAFIAIIKWKASSTVKVL